MSSPDFNAELIGGGLGAAVLLCKELIQFKVEVVIFDFFFGGSLLVNGP